MLKEAPWQIVIFSLGMYLVVYGLRNAGLTQALAGWLDAFAVHGVWGATFGTGLLTALLSSIMNNLPTVLDRRAVDRRQQRHGRGEGGDGVRQRDRQRPGPENHADWQPGHVVVAARAGAQGIRITWGYYSSRIVLTVPVLLITLAALAVRLGG